MLEPGWQSWAEAVFRRRSRRRFVPNPVAPEALARLESVCRGFRPFGRARAVLVREAPPELFRGIVGAYGRVKGAPHCLVMIGPKGAAAEVGYVGEAAVLETTALGLGSCWVGGLFDPDRARALTDLTPGERVLAVSPVGWTTESETWTERTMAAVAQSHRRRPLNVIASGCGAWPAWARRGAELARLAPSAMNRQPWRFAFEDGAVTLIQDSPRDTYRIPKRLDCGIAMLHFELGARQAGATGRWQILPPPRVGFFRQA